MVAKAAGCRAIFLHKTHKGAKAAGEALVLAIHRGVKGAKY